jgi:hypothetical protein
MTPYSEGLDIDAPGYETAAIRNRWFDFGVYAFFDAQYMEFDLGYFGAASGKYVQSNFGHSNYDFETEYNNLNISYLDLALMVKYPFKLSSLRIPIFAGFAYSVNLSHDYSHKSNSPDVSKKDWDQMWIKLGMGLDYDLSPNVFLRASFSLAIPLITEDWKDRAQDIDSWLGMVIPGVDASYTGIGSDIILGLGWRLK